MDPKWLFPVLALVFALLAIGRGVRSGLTVGGAVRTWALMAVIFGVVSAWLHWHT